MMSTGAQFPKDDLINGLRNSAKIDHILKQVNKLNIEWIYEIVKYIHNVLIDSKENPNTKLNAIKLIKSIIETCDVPCFALVQVYLLQILFSVASYKPQQTGQRRGHRFFTQNGYSPRIPDIEETGIKFMGLCTEVLYVCSQIKTRRTLENEELNQQSQFVQSYNRLKSVGVTGISSISELKFFTQNFARNGRDKYLQKLKNFEQYSEQYSEYFVIKMIQSLQTEQNPLFSNTGKTVSSLSTDLDMRKLLKYGDTYITSPLIQELMDGLQTSQNFVVKKNFLSLLSDFVKWADIQAFVQVSYEDTIDGIAFRISEIDGQNGFNEGEQIYPEVKGQKQAKKKFYIEFLKCIEVWSKCITNDLDNPDEPSKVKELYEFFKLEKNFKFPQNLMAKRIEGDFYQCSQFNRERNERILQKLRDDETSLLNNKKSINSIGKAATLSKMKQNQVRQKTLSDIKKQIERCYDYLNTLFDHSDYVDFKMKQLFVLKETLDKDLQNLADDPDYEQIIETLDEGDVLIEQIDIIEPIYKEYKQGKISFDEFAKKISQELEEVDEEEFEQKKSKSRSRSRSKSRSRKSRSIRQSGDQDKNQVITSYNNHSNHLLNGRQTVKNSEEFTHGVPICIAEEQQEFPERFSSPSEDPSFHQNMMTGKSKMDSCMQQSNNFNSEPSEKTFEKNSMSRPSYFQNKVSRLSNKSIASSLRERMSFKKSRRSYLSKNQQSQISSSQPYQEESSVNRQEMASEMEQYQINPMKSSFNIYSKELTEKSKLSQSKKSKLKSIISSHRSNRSSAKSKLSSSHKKSSIMKKSSLKKSSSIYKESSYADENNNNGDIYYAQALQTQTYNMISTSKSHNLVKFDKYKSNLSDKKNQNFVEKASQKSSVYDKNKKNSFLQENQTPNRHHFSVSQKIDKESQNDQVYDEEYFVKSGEKFQPMNSMKYSSMKKSKHGKQSQQSRFQKSENFSKRQQFSKDQVEEDKAQSSKFSRSSKISKSKLSKNSENVSGYYGRDSMKSSNYSHLVSEYYENDLIKEPSLKPLENSYYGIQQIEAKVKCQKKPLFKECFDVDKEIISSQQNKMVWICKNNQYDLFRKERKINEKASKIQGEYLLKKLRGAKGSFQTESSRPIYNNQSRNGSRLKINDKSRQFSRRSEMSSSKEVDFYSSHKSQKSASSYNSLSKGKSSFMSRNNVETIEGKIVNLGIYDQYFINMGGNDVKKSLLKSKTLLKKTQEVEIGALCKYEDGLKIKIYLTSMHELEDLKYGFSNHSNFNMKCYPEYYAVVPENKQIRISLQMELKKMPFTLPQMLVSFTKQDERFNYTFYLPCYTHKFIAWKSINPSKFNEEFKRQSKNLIKTQEFRMNRKVLKADKLVQYIENGTVISEEGKNKIVGVEGTWKDQNFFLKFIINRSSHMTIQALSKNNPEFAEYIMCSLYYLFVADE